MSIEKYLSEKLQKFTMVDLAFVKLVYFVFGLWVCVLYPKLGILSYWFYFLLTLLCALPLWIHLFSQPGTYVDKMHGYLRSNNPSNQVLLFLSMFFLSLMFAVLFPVLVHPTWWIYLIVIVVLAIKPMSKTWFW